MLVNKVKEGAPAWLSQLTFLTLDFSSGRDRMIHEFKPCIRLRADGVEPAWYSFSFILIHSLSLSLSPSLPHPAPSPLVCARSLKINKLEKQVRENFPEKVTFESTSVRCRRKPMPGRENTKCKGPEARLCSECRWSCKKARVRRVDEMQGQEVGVGS